MSPNSYSYKKLVSALKTIGLKKNDLVLVHSSLFALGAMEDVSPKDLTVKCYEAIREVIGHKGTLLVPTVFEEYARFGKPYDCVLSPVDPLVGIFSSYVARLKGSYRTYCPLLSLTGNGPLAKEICHSWTASACGANSAWEKLYEYDAKICYLGVRPSQAFTFLRFIQFRYGVPYIYNKIFTTPIYENKKLVSLSVICPVRYLNPQFKISENSLPFEEHLTVKKLVRIQNLGKGKVYLLPSAQKVFDEGIKKLNKNLYYFLKEKPQFTPGKIPMDGKVGAYVKDELRFAQAAK